MQEGRNPPAYAFQCGNPENDRDEPQRPCSAQPNDDAIVDIGRQEEGGRVEHYSQVLMAEGASEGGKARVSDSGPLADDAPRVTDSGATVASRDVPGSVDRASLCDIDMLDGDSTTAKAGTTSSALTADEGLRPKRDEATNAFRSPGAPTAGGPELGAGTSSENVLENVHRASLNSADALERLEYKDLMPFEVERERSTSRDRCEGASHGEYSLKHAPGVERSPFVRAQGPAASVYDVPQSIGWDSLKSGEDKAHLDNEGLPLVDTLSTISSRDVGDGLILRKHPVESTSGSGDNGADRSRNLGAGANNLPLNLPSKGDPSRNSSAMLERSGHDESCPLEDSSEETLPGGGDYRSPNDQDASRTASGPPEQPMRCLKELQDRSLGIKRPRSQQNLAETQVGKRHRCSSESALLQKGSLDVKRDFAISGPVESSESIDIEVTVVEGEGEPQFSLGGDAAVAGDAPQVEEAPLPDLFDFSVLRDVIVSVGELPMTSNLLEAYHQDSN